MYKILGLIACLISFSDQCVGQTNYSMSLVQGMELLKLTDTGYGVGHLPGESNRPAYWDRGAISEIPVPPEVQGLFSLSFNSLDVNSSGQVVGSVDYRGQFSNPLGPGVCPVGYERIEPCSYGFEWSALDGFNRLSSSYGHFRPSAVNDAGQVVGEAMEFCPSPELYYPYEACEVAQATAGTAIEFRWRDR